MQIKSVITTVLCVLSLQASAQKYLFVKPVAGIVLTTERGAKHSNILTYNAGVDIGYSINKIRLTTGLKYMKTGRLYQGSIMATPTSYQLADITFMHQHLVIPATIGYNLRFSNNVFFVPEIGAAYSYNMGEILIIKTVNEKTRSTGRNLSTDQFVRHSLCGVGHMNFEYSVNSKINLTLSPSFYYFFGLSNNSPSNRATINTYAASIDLGVMIKLGSNKNANEPTDTP